MLEVLDYLKDNVLTINLWIITIYLGFEIISKVPTVLHTPLMSGSNAISGIVIIGAIILTRRTPSTDYVSMITAFVGIILATINVVGGHAVTHRMLEMFKKK